MSHKIVLEEISKNKIYGGQQMRFRHESKTLNCEMTFSIFIPEKGENEIVPVLYWLSGLTCTDENFVLKSGFQKYGEWRFTVWKLV